MDSPLFPHKTLFWESREVSLIYLGWQGTDPKGILWCLVTKYGVF